MSESYSISTLPNVFLIGAPKCGTTALSTYLRTHPNVYFPRAKEPNFFNSDDAKRLKISKEAYLSLFSAANPAFHKAIADGTTGYLHSKVAVSEILKFNPQAKFIAMLRNPIDLVQAWHAQLLFEGEENIGDFEKAWSLEAERRNGKSIPCGCSEPNKLFYSEWGKLGSQIERLFSLTDNRYVKIIIFDDFVADTKSIYEEVLDFLKVPADGKKHFGIINENRKVHSVLLQQTVAMLLHFVWRIRAASGQKFGLGIGLSPKLLSLNSKRCQRPPLSATMRAELNNFYREDVKRLSQILHRDLSGWVSVFSDALR